MVKGPVRMPTKCLRITTRKTPCGDLSSRRASFLSFFNCLSISLLILSAILASSDLQH